MGSSQLGLDRWWFMGIRSSFMYVVVLMRDYQGGELWGISHFILLSYRY